MSEHGVRCILFIGTANWPQRLSNLANKYCGDCVVARSISLSVWKFPALIYWMMKSDAIVRVGLRPGAANWKMFVFDTIWYGVQLLNKKALFCYYWIGTDVMMAANSNVKNSFYFQRSRRDRHLVGAPWFIDELAEVEIDATVCIFPLDLVFDQPIREDLTKVSVLTYVPEARSDFYAGELYLRLARSYPDIDFHIVGGEGNWANSIPNNVHFHGWVRSLEPFLASRPILVRLVPHDAIGGTIREGLAYGCHVICTYDIPTCNKVTYGSFVELHSVFSRVLTRRSSADTAFNMPGLEYAQKNWCPEVLIKGLLVELAGDIAC